MTPLITRLSRERGAALIIVLAFVVLLSTVVVAYLSRTATDRPLAQSGFANSAADVLARSALDIIIADFKQEIADGLTPPSPIVNMVPQRNVSTSAGIPNLIRISVAADPISAPAVDSRASNVNSANPLPAPSISTRLVTKARWNKHYLIPRDPAIYGGGSATTIGTDPIPAFAAPDWVFVNNLGPTVLTTPDPSVIGRYAYAVYDEGGLLDVNVAGFPSPTSGDATYKANIGRKGVLAFADLTVTGLSAGAVDNIIGYRNYLSALPTGSYGTFSFPLNPTAFVTYFLSTSRAFLTANIPASYPGSGAPPRIDQSFITRSQLLELRRTLTSSQDAMQYLGTFSYEINHSTWGTSLTLLAGRFPLSRFDMFENFSPSMATQAIQQFGLVQQPAGGGHEVHWQYTGTGGTNPQSSITNLSGTNQDPDAASLLNYALPGRPIGEILSILASLIDQVDSDDETTWIEYASVGSLTADQKAFGVDRTASTEPDAPARPATIAVINRAFRNVGEIGYAYKNGSTGVDFISAVSSEAPLLDLFTYNTATKRAGIVNLNTQNPAVLAAIIQRAFSNDSSATKVVVGQNDPPSDPSKSAYDAAVAIITNPVNGTAVKPALGRQDVARLVAAAGAIIGTGEEEKETVARALAEVGQTRVWGLFIDVIAQTGRYAPGTTNLANFIVQAEKRYWLHIAIDRLTGKVIDQQLEAVYE